MTEDEKFESSRIEKGTNGQRDEKRLKIWQSLVKHYEMVEGAHLSNSFVILLALIEAKQPLSSADISKVIALCSEGKLYKPASTLKDSLEKRLKREGFVESTDLANKSRYSITPLGKKLVKGWISFISTYST
ncbi:MAG: hypothetical protein ACRD47_10470 [Nitrososphaeraceae archaeon]